MIELTCDETKGSKQNDRRMRNIAAIAGDIESAIGALVNNCTKGRANDLYMKNSFIAVNPSYRKRHGRYHRHRPDSKKKKHKGTPEESISACRVNVGACDRYYESN